MVRMLGIDPATGKRVFDGGRFGICLADEGEQSPWYPPAEAPCPAGDDGEGHCPEVKRGCYPRLAECSECGNTVRLEWEV